MILPENVNLPMGISRAEINALILDEYLTPGDTLRIEWPSGRKIVIRCRGVWKSCFCFKIAGYTVKEIK